MNRMLLVLLLAGTTLAARAEAQTGETVPPGENFHIQFGTMWWQPTPELSIQTGSLAANNVTDFDLAQEFGIEDRRFSNFQLVLAPARAHKFRVAYVPVRYNQPAVLQRNVTFGRRTFARGTGADVDVEWKMWRFGYEWDFVRRDRGFVGFLADVHYNKVTAAVTSRAGAELADANAPIPTIGVIGRAYVHPNVSITGEVSGLKIPGGDNADFRATYLHVDLSVTASLSRHFGVQGGYRAISADYLVDQDAGNLKLKGPYFGLVSRF